MNEELTAKKQLKISLPIAFENFVNLLMTLIDTLVVTTLGTSAVGAIGAMGVIIDIMQMSIQSLNTANIALLSKTVLPHTIMLESLSILTALYEELPIRL